MTLDETPLIENGYSHVIGHVDSHVIGQSNSRGEGALPMSSKTKTNSQMLDMTSGRSYRLAPPTKNLVTLGYVLLIVELFGRGRVCGR